MRTKAPAVLALLLLASTGVVVWGLFRELAPAPRADPAPAPARQAPARVAAPPELRPAPVAQDALAGPSAGPDPCYLNNEAGVSALDAGDLELAVACFESSRKDCPEVDVYGQNLAEALARLAIELEADGGPVERARALELLERAACLAPERAVLGDLLDRWRRSVQAERGFERLLSEHFEIAFDLDRNEVREEIGYVRDLLEEAYLELGECFGHFPVEAGEARIRVVLYTRAEFDQVTGLGDWAGGAFDGAIRAPVKDLASELPRIARVLRHELLHAFVAVVGGDDVPGWLNEGLAQLLESKGESARAFDVARARAALEHVPLFPLAELQGGLAGWTDTARIERAYAQALGLVAHIEAHYGERVVFEMVSSCRAGETPEQSFRRRVGLELETVLADLAREVGE